MEEFPAIQELWKVLRRGRPFTGGQAFINEETFFVATSRLKKQLLGYLTALGYKNFNGDPKIRQALDAIDALEGIIEVGKFHLGGLVLIRKQVFSDKMADVQAALEQLGTVAHGGISKQHAIPDSPWS